MNEFGKISAIVLAVVCAVAVASLPSLEAESSAPVQIGGDDLLSMSQDGVLILDDDYTLTTALKISGTLRMDLNGHAIVNGTSDHTISVIDGGNLTITDSKGSGQVNNITNGKAALAVWPGAVATISGGTFDRSAETGESIDVSGDNSWYTIKNQGTLTIDGATVRNSGSFSSCINNGWYDGTSEVAHANDLEPYNGTNAKLYIYDGTVDGGINSVKNDDAGELYISGGTFTNTTQATVLNWNITEISGGTFESEKNVLMNGYGNDTLDRGIITVTGGTFRAGENGSCISYMNGNSAGTVYNIAGGSFTSIDDAVIGEGSKGYEFDGMHIVSINDEGAAALIVSGIPFETVSDAMTIMDPSSDSIVVNGNSMKLVKDLDISDKDLRIPAGSSIVLDLNGHIIAMDGIIVSGTLSLIDKTGEGHISSTGMTLDGGAVSGNGTITSTGETTELIGIRSSGTLCGVTLDISNNLSGGAVMTYGGLTGSVVVKNVTISSKGDGVADHGIYINETAKTGSVVLSDISFAFNGASVCPINADVNADSNVDIAKVSYAGCERVNKILINATGNVSIGTEGNVRLADVSDVVLWNADSDEDVFTVVGDLVMNGRLVITSSGSVIVPDESKLVVNGSMELGSDGHVEGRILFGSNGNDSIVLSDVVAGSDGFVMSLGSVVMSGTVSSGNISVNGKGVVKGDVDLGSAVLTVPEGSTLSISKGSELTGESGLDVKGKVNVYGSLAAPVQNDGAVYTIGSGTVTGGVVGNEVLEKEEEPLSVEFIPDMDWKLGESRSIPLGIHPIDAEITGITGADWLTFTGHVITGVPTEAGEYEITITIGLDGMSATANSFTITVSDDVPGDASDDRFDWSLVIIIVFIAIICIMVIRMIL